MHLREVEEKRVCDAFTLAALSRIDELRPKQVLYRSFLRRVNMAVGPQGVVICAAGLGISAVANMKDRVRLEVPAQMKDRENELLRSTVRDIAHQFAPKGEMPPWRAKSPSAEETAPFDQNIGAAENGPNNSSDGVHQMDVRVPNHSIQPDISQYAGDAYALNWQDVETVVRSEQVVGQVYLVETYSRRMNSFMLVPVSDEVTRFFAMQREQV